MAEPLRHRQTKGAETDMPSLPPPCHIPTLPRGVVGYSVLCVAWRFFIISNHSDKRSFCRAELRSLEDPHAMTQGRCIQEPKVR